MDLYTRGLLLGGLFAGMLLIAGVALLIGRALQRQHADQDRFDVGKGRKRRKKPKAKKPRTSRTSRVSRRRTAKTGDSVVESEQGGNGEVSGIENAPESSGESVFVEELPPVPGSQPEGPSPFRSGRAQSDEPW